MKQTSKSGTPVELHYQDAKGTWETGCRMPGATEACEGYSTMEQQLAQAVEALEAAREFIEDIDMAEAQEHWKPVEEIDIVLAAIKGEGK